jgi:hypothetical protein
VHNLRGDSKNKLKEESENLRDRLEAYYLNRPNEYNKDCLCTLKDNDVVTLDWGSKVLETLSVDRESKSESKFESFAA